jgi:hypothetical protein
MYYVLYYFVMWHGRDVGREFVSDVIVWLVVEGGVGVAMGLVGGGAV